MLRIAVLLLVLVSNVYASRNDVLVIVNDNSIDSPLLGEYYAQQRGIGPANIAHVRVPSGYYLTWDQFVLLRDQLIKHIQDNLLPASTAIADCIGSASPYYCDASMNQIRSQSPVKYIVVTRGIPTRLQITGQSQLTSLDSLLRFWLANYYDTPTAGLDATLRAKAFADGRGMRVVDPALDNEMVIGRVDGLDLASAMALVDRTIAAEQNGLYGKLYGSQYGSSTGGRARWWDYEKSENIYGSSGQTAWRYQHGLFGDLLSPQGNAVSFVDQAECLTHIENNAGTAAGKSPQDCVVRLTDGSDAPPGRASSRQPLVDNGLVYLGSLDGQPTTGSFAEFLNWRKDAQCTVTLCEDAADPAACAAISTDVFREMNTECVGVADGFIGYNFQSYPVSFFTVWPTGWYNSMANSNSSWTHNGGGDAGFLGLPEIVDGDSADGDGKSLWFRNTDAVASYDCYTDATFINQSGCVDEKTVFINSRTDLPTPVSFNAVAPQTYKFSLKYKAQDIDRLTQLKIRLFVSEPGSGSFQVNYGATDVSLPGQTSAFKIPVGNTNAWTEVQAKFTIDPAKHAQARTDCLNNAKCSNKINATFLNTPWDGRYDGIKVRLEIPSVFQGGVGFDDTSLTEVTTSTSVVLNNPSFVDGHKQVSAGDHAANFLSRLNGVGFWGSVSHYMTGGFSFDQHPMDTLIYLVRGLPLGDSVWFAESRPSGILYGDPLYSPMSVKFDYLNNPGDRIANSAILSGNAINGRDTASVVTDYRIDYCPGDDFFVCDQQQSWQSTGLAGNGVQTGQVFGSWNIGGLPYGDYTLRLSVTSSNLSLGKTQTFNDFYPVKNRYATNEIPTYRIAGTILDQSGQPLSGVSVAVNDNFGFASTVTTNAEGKYVEDGLANGLYIVYPTKPGHTFSANSGNIFQSVNNAHVTKDFTANNSDFTVSGTVTDTNGQAVPGATVQISDNSGFTDTVTTNVNGYYSRPGIGNGVYIVWITKNGYSIGPAQGNVFQSVNGSDVVKDFVATPQNFSISGTVLGGNGNPLPGVSVSVSNNSGSSSTVTSNASGFYSVSGLSNGAYIVFPAKSGYNISVNSGNIFQGINGADVSGKDFTATQVKQTFSISGYILENGQPVPGVSIQISDNSGFSSTATTDNAGFYTQDGLEDGTYIVYPTMVGYQFSSVTGNIFQGVSGSNIINKDFSATLVP